MAPDGDELGLPPGSERLPDERRAIAERLEDEESHLTVDEGADELGIALE